MTIDVARYRETNYVKPHKKTFYPVKIPIKHHQLRHYISVAEGGIVYYVSENELWALHTGLRQRERIADLDFAPQCLGAAFGWICVGGLHGQCAFVDIKHAVPFFDGIAASDGAAVDQLLPLNLDPHPRDPSEPDDNQMDSRLHAQHTSKIYTRQVGAEIVNSITMYKMKSIFEGVVDEEVATISSNDKTVQIFSLRELRTVCTLEFPVAMNHATISPDGNTLLACGDDMSAFFVRRCEIANKATGTSLLDRYEWAPPIKCQLTGTVRPDHCFSTAFSPTGHICTVASQFGAVTVFDMDKVWNRARGEATMGTFLSSRPAAFHDESRFIEMPGAVRSTAFSPEPWDLFAWAEDQGRICVTDLRDGFRSRQMIQLDLKSKELEGIEIADIEDTQDVDLRNPSFAAAYMHRQAQSDENGSAASVQGATQYIEQAAARRRQLHAAAGHDHDPHELTETERQILETLRVERLRESAEAGTLDTSSTPFSINYSNIPSSNISSGSQSIREFLRERNLDRDPQSNSVRAYNPRRQSSIVISNSGDANHPASSVTNSNSPSLTPFSATNGFSTSPSQLSSLPQPQVIVSSTSQTEIHDVAAAAAAASSSSPSSPPTTTSGTNPWVANQSNVAPSPNTQPTRSSPLLDLFNVSGDAPSHQQVSPLNLSTISQERQPSALEDYQAQYRLLHERARERSNMGRSLLNRDRTRSTYQHPELEQARAQLVRLTAAVEADTEDVLRHLRLRVAGDRTRLRESENTASNNTNENTESSRANFSARENAMLGSRSWTRDQRMNAVREAQYRRLQDRAAVSAGMGRDEFRDRTYITSLIGTERTHGSAIMGMGWSHDGRELFVATEDGIFRLEINMDLRKQFPAIHLR